MIYICEGYETTDLICYKVYGHHNDGIIGKVRDLNQDTLTNLYLSFVSENRGFYREIMPKGLKLTLPEAQDTVQQKQVRRLF